MMQPEIIGNPRSTYTRAIRIVCEEKGINHTFTEAAPHSEPVSAIHPLGKVPVLRHGEVTLFESVAIATYLDRTFDGPRLIPSDAYLAAQTEQWVSLVNTVIDRTMIRTYLFAYIFTPDGKPNRAQIEAALPDLRTQFALLDKSVARSGHLVGTSYTFADINLMPILFYVQRFPEGAEALASARDLSAYYEKHAARPSFIRTMPPAGPPRRG
jgi:glutathione S-transferase